MKPKDTGDPVRRKREEEEWRKGVPKRLRFKKRWSRWWWAYCLRDAVVDWLRSLWTVEMVYSTMRAIVVLFAGIAVVTTGYHILHNPHSARKELPTTEEILRLDCDHSALK